MWVVTAYFVEPCKFNTSYILRDEIDSRAFSKIAGCHRITSCLSILCIKKLSMRCISLFKALFQLSTKNSARNCHNYYYLHPWRKKFFIGMKILLSQWQICLNISIIRNLIGDSDWFPYTLYYTQSKSDWLFSTQFKSTACWLVNFGKQ